MASEASQDSFKIELEALSRPELQAVAKQHGLKANRASAALIADLVAAQMERHLLADVDQVSNSPGTPWKSRASPSVSPLPAATASPLDEPLDEEATKALAHIQATQQGLKALISPGGPAASLTLPTSLVTPSRPPSLQRHSEGCTMQGKLGPMPSGSPWKILNEA